MAYKKSLHFLIEGFLGNFRVQDAITTQLTNIIPPKTAIIGMVAGMAGIIKPRNNYSHDYILSLVDSFEVGVKLLSRPIKYTDYVIYRDKRKSTGHKQQPTYIEYLISPKYEIFVIPKDMDNAPMDPNELIELANEMEFFVPNLGNLNCPGRIYNKSIVNLTESSGNSIKSKFIVPISRNYSVSGENYFVENLRGMYMGDFYVPLPGSQLEVTSETNFKYLTYDGQNFITF